MIRAWATRVVGVLRTGVDSVQKGPRMTAIFPTPGWIDVGQCQSLKTVFRRHMEVA